MITRSSLSVIFLAFAVALLVLFVGSDTAHGITWKIGLTTSLSDTTAGANADIVTTFNVAAAHTNFTKVDTTSAPTEWSIALDSAVPDGAAVGQVVATSTLSVLGAPCWTTVLVTIPLFDATTAETNAVDWTGDGSNLTLDPDGNGLPAGLEQYPSFLNTIFNGLKPQARAYGYTSAVVGAPPTQLNFVIFNPGEFVAAAGWPGFPKPEQEINDALGYENFVVLDNPVPGNAAPSTIQEFCAPLSTVTTLWGKSKGEGEAIPAVGGPEVTQQCAGAQVGVDNDLDGTPDDGCIVVTDACGDSVDNDADGWTDESCDVARATNPPAQSGIYGTGTHLFHGYAHSQRDFDNDGISNNEDGCPTNPDRTNIGGTGQNSSRELVSSGASSGGNECDDATDDDGDTIVNDGCPGGPRTVADDTGDTGNANNGVGDVCETLVNCPAVNAADCDADGYQNRQDNCPLVANGLAGNNQLDDDLDRCGNNANDDAADDTAINDGCPAVGCAESYSNSLWTLGQCANNTDDDGDTVINDGCPMVGAIAEICVNGGAADFGPCYDGIGNSCDNVAGLSATVADGAYAKDLAVSAVCVGEADSDVGGGDGWCDSTEALLGSDPTSSASTPEHTAIDYKVVQGNVATTVNGACNAGTNTCIVASAAGMTAGQTVVIGPPSEETRIIASIAGTTLTLTVNLASSHAVGGLVRAIGTMDPVPSVCNDFQWYASGTDAIGNGPAVDNDLQGGSNAGEEDGVDPGTTPDCAFADPECLDAVDDDADTNVNDGCPAVSTAENAGCVNATDDDGDTNTNDGCPAKGAVENPACVNDIDDDAVDDGADPRVNDGCPAKGAAENPQCTNNTNDDLWDDSVANDGCPASGAAEIGSQCTGIVDEDADTFVNDGCIQVGGFSEDQGQCLSNVDDDGDTRVNDGCPKQMALAENPSCANDVDDDADTRVNDGCPQKGTVEDPSCANDLNDDSGEDSVVNDGCPAKGGSEWDTDQDGVAGIPTALWNKTDSCEADWNPEQLNTDKGAGEVAATGDTCDSDDDEDKITDVLEWKQGSDSKNVFSPRDFDMTGDDAANVLDILTMTGATAYPVVGGVQQLPDYLYPSCCCKAQTFTYTFLNNTGGNVNAVKIWWATPLQIVSISDNDTPPNVWSKKMAVVNRASLKRLTGNLTNGKTLTIRALSCKKQQVVCYQWLVGTPPTPKGGSWNSTDCAVLQAP